MTDELSQEQHTKPGGEYPAVSVVKDNTLAPNKFDLDNIELVGETDVQTGSWNPKKELTKCTQGNKKKLRSWNMGNWDWYML